MNELILYGLKGRSRAERVLWVLQELQLPHRFVQLDYLKGENKSETYLKLNPAGKLPTLVDGDFILSESMAICFYLCGLSDRVLLIPTEQKQAAVFYQRIFFAVTELEPYLWLSDKERFVKDEEMPIGIADYSIKKIATAFTSINRWLETSSYIAGETFTLADILYYHLVTWSSIYGIPQTQAVAAYIERLANRDAFPQSMAKAGSPAVTG
ncbi:MAG: glutathione S-transferase family protein [Methylococcaceae bacterium]|jgi:glutathione S-transferase|nr:glutathione S-transferase family protein [Methylococcaceae bacterium]